MRQLRLWINDSEVGLLSETDNLWRFEYSRSWLSSAESFDLSPSLPKSEGSIADGASKRPVQWFFDNLLPEEGARRLLARDAKIAEADQFGLLAWYGAESAGALTLLPLNQSPADGSLVPLSDETLSARIRALPGVALSSSSPKRMSLAGAQHKLAVVLNDDQLYEPTGASASTHILKPDHPVVDDYAHSAINEWYVMSLAAALGLSVPKVHLRRVPESVYIVERFDRFDSDGQVVRRHLLDGCQLLSIAAGYKYSAATFKNLSGLIDLCRTKASTRQAIFSWLVFNMLIGNNDAHLKNLSFFSKPQGIALAPHYDLLSTTIYEDDNRWLDAELPWMLDGLRFYRDMSRKVMIGMGQAIGLPGKPAERLLDFQLKRIVPFADKLLAHAEDTAPGGEVRLLRGIRYGVLVDMLRLLV